MKQLDDHALADAVLGMAHTLGADAAGIVAWAELAAGPSYRIQPSLKAYSGVGAVGRSKEYVPEGQPGSLLIVGLAHPADKRELDWWQEDLPRRTLGNDLLADITGGVASWLLKEHYINAWDVPYHPGRGGVFLKDAAVLAGLGCVGRNNLFIAPDHGPRIRLRAMGLEASLPSSGVIKFDPCAECDAPCRKVCPQGAMSQAWLGDLEGPSHLPARDGSYDRSLCNQQMESDIADHRMVPRSDTGQPFKQVRYCRRCEIACVAGRQSSSAS